MTSGATIRKKPKTVRNRTECQKCTRFPPGFHCPIETSITHLLEIRQYEFAIFVVTGYCHILCLLADLRRIHDFACRSRSIAPSHRVYRHDHRAPSLHRSIVMSASSKLCPRFALLSLSREPRSSSLPPFIVFASPVHRLVHSVQLLRFVDMRVSNPYPNPSSACSWTCASLTLTLIHLQPVRGQKCPLDSSHP